MPEEDIVEPALEVEESVPAPAEVIPAQNEPVDAPTPESQTAQIPVSEPLPATREPIAPPSTNSARDLLIKARATKQSRIKKKREKILEALNATGKITNDEVEKLLHVSDATATRYLSALEKEGKIKQVGKTGAGVQYQKI